MPSGMTSALVPVTSAEVDAASDPVQYVVLACQRAKAWLADALEHGDIEQIVELKSQAEAVRIYTQQKQLGKDAELSAANIVRRAERGIGLATRKGQQAGEITTKRDAGLARHGIQQSRDTDLLKRSPAEFFQNNDERTAVYAMTDGVTDEQFEAALAEAKTEGNLSRANVVRKVKEAAEPAPADAAPRRAPRRRPLTAQADDTGWDIRKAAEKVTRILADDRYPNNKEQVRLALRGHLLFVTETVAVALEQLGNQSTLEDS